MLRVGPRTVEDLADAMRARGVLHLELHPDGGVKTMVLGPAPNAEASKQESDEEKRDRERQEERRTFYAASGG